MVSLSDTQAEEILLGLEPGTLVGGRYRVIRDVGGGGSGRIYEAEQIPIERHVALKVLSTGSVSDLFTKRFRREASAASRISHPNVVTVYDFGLTDDGAPFIAMELVEGPCLQDVLQQQGALSLRRSLYIALQVTRALRKAHALGVVHRDLKPANIMTLPDEDDLDFIKVLDFGLVKVLGPEVPTLGEVDDENLTRAGVLLGTPGYMAPEQATGDAIDGRTDLYSVGVLLFQMLAGRLPFTGQTMAQVISAQVTGNAPFINEVAPDANVPDELETIVHRCLRRDPDLRFRDADHLLQALKYVWHLDTGQTFGTEASLLPFDIETADVAPLAALLQEPLAEDHTVEKTSAELGPSAGAPKLWAWLAVAVGTLVVLGFVAAQMWITPPAASDSGKAPVTEQAPAAKAQPAAKAEPAAKAQPTAGSAEEYKDNPYE